MERSLGQISASIWRSRAASVLGGGIGAGIGAALLLGAGWTEALVFTLVVTIAGTLGALVAHIRNAPD